MTFNVASVYIIYIANVTTNVGHESLFFFSLPFFLFFFLRARRLATAHVGDYALEYLGVTKIFGSSFTTSLSSSALGSLEFARAALAAALAADRSIIQPRTFGSTFRIVCIPRCGYVSPVTCT